MSSTVLLSSVDTSSVQPVGKIVDRSDVNYDVNYDENDEDLMMTQKCLFQDGNIIVAESICENSGVNLVDKVVDSSSDEAGHVTGESVDEEKVLENRDGHQSEPSTTSSVASRPDFTEGSSISLNLTETNELDERNKLDVNDYDPSLEDLRVSDEESLESHISAVNLTIGVESDTGGAVSSNESSKESKQASYTTSSVAEVMDKMDSEENSSVEFSAQSQSERRKILIPTCKPLGKSLSVDSSPVASHRDSQIDANDSSECSLQASSNNCCVSVTSRFSDPGSDAVSNADISPTLMDIGKPPLKYSTVSLGRRRTFTWSGLRGQDKDWKASIRVRLSLNRSQTPTSTPPSPSKEGVVKNRRRRIGSSVLSKMSEGRMTHVTLLDERILEITVQPKLSGEELRDLVASHCSLKEKEYFSFTFIDDTGQRQWLQLDRRVLEQDLPKRASTSGPLLFKFQIRLFISSISRLSDNVTIELFYHQAKQLLFEDVLECDADTVFELSAYVLQASHGDYVDEVTSRAQIKKLPLLPTTVLKEYPSISHCEDQIIQHHQRLKGQSRGAIVVNYMSIVESLPTYGVHFYEVKDKNGIPWWLGVSFRGVSLYDIGDRRNPRKVYYWKNLENLFFRERKFSIEVVETLRRSGSFGRNSSSSNLLSGGKLTVHSWSAGSSLVAKNIWTMAVSQHQFYLDCKHCKLSLGPTRCLADIASDLNQSTRSLAESCSSSSTGGNPHSFINSTPSLATQHSVGPCPEQDSDSEEGRMIRSSSAHCLRTGSGTVVSAINYENIKKELLEGGTGEMNAKQLEARREAQLLMHKALKTHKDSLQKQLEEKLQLLRELCLKESELTGVIPQEYPRTPGEQTPVVKKRIGTAFTLSPHLLDKNSGKDETSDASKLEMECEVQAQIVTAALRLAKDKSLPRIVRRNHKETYRRATEKLSELKAKLSRCHSVDDSRRTFLTSDPPMDDLSEDSCEFLDEDIDMDSPIRRRRSGTVGEERGGGLDDPIFRQINKRQQLLQQQPPRPNTVAGTRPQLQHCNSVPQKMEYEKYNRPPTSIRSTPSSSSSLTSLKDPTPSPGVKTGPAFRDQDVPSPAIKIYPKKVVRGAPSPRSGPRRSHKSSMDQLSSSSQSSTPVPGRMSSGARTFAEESHPGFATHSDHEDKISNSSSTSEYLHHSGTPMYKGHSAAAYTGSKRSNDAQQDLIGYRGSSKDRDAYNVSSGACYNETSETVDEADDYKAYLERTQTWPANPRRSITPADICSRIPYSAEDPEFSHAAAESASAENLAELSPSKFGSKRESKSDAADSPYRFVEGSLRVNGEENGTRVQGRRNRRQRSETPGRTVASKNMTNYDFSDDFSADYRGSLSNSRISDNDTNSFDSSKEVKASHNSLRPEKNEERWCNQEIVAANYVEQSKPLQSSDVLKYSQKYREQIQNNVDDKLHCNRKLDYNPNYDCNSYSNARHNDLQGYQVHLPEQHLHNGTGYQNPPQWEQCHSESDSKKKDVMYGNADSVTPTANHDDGGFVVQSHGNRDSAGGRQRRARPLVKREGAMLERNHDAVDALFRHNEDNIGTLPLLAHSVHQPPSSDFVRGVAPVQSDSGSLPYMDEYAPPSDLGSRHHQGSKALNKSFHPLDGGVYPASLSVGNSPMVFQRVPHPNSHQAVDSTRLYSEVNSVHSQSAKRTGSEVPRIIGRQTQQAMIQNAGSTSTLASSNSSGIDWCSAHHDQPDVDAISTLV